MEQCRLVRDCRQRKETFQWCFDAIQLSIKVNLDPLEATAAFTYLGRNIMYNNSNWTDLYHNMEKARRWWVMLSKVMEKTGEAVRDREIMYKSVV